MEPLRQAPPLTEVGDQMGKAELNAQARASVFVPVLLMALAVVAWLAFECVQLVRERQQLSLAQASLQPQEQAAAKLRASLDAMATATARLAAEGNANARVIVDELRKRGVTINSLGLPKPQ